MTACPQSEIILLTGRFHTKTGFCQESNTYQNPSEPSKSKASAVLGNGFDATILSTALPTGKQYKECV